MKARLATIIDAIEMADDASTGFLNLDTMETIWLNDYFDCEANEALSMEIDNHPKKYLCLPSHYDIHEYSIMEDFIDSLTDSEMKKKLNRAILGKGAFRRFKDAVLRFGIREQWFSFQHDAYVEMARRWCEQNQLEYEAY